MSSNKRETFDLRELEEGVEVWFTNQVAYATIVKETKEFDKREKQSNLTEHEKLVQVMLDNSVYRTVPLQLLADQISSGCSFCTHPSAVRFMTQWKFYIQQIHSCNMDLIKDKATQTEDYFKKFLYTLNFDTVFTNELFKRCPPLIVDATYDTMIATRPLVSYQVPGNRKRARPTDELQPVNDEVIPFVRYVFERSLKQACINELQYYTQTTLENAIAHCVGALIRTREHSTVILSPTPAARGDELDEKHSSPSLSSPLDNKLADMVSRTITQWKEAFAAYRGAADLHEAENKQALSELSDKANKLAADNTAYLVSSPTSMDYLADYSNYTAVKGAEDGVRLVSDTLNACTVVIQKLLQSSNHIDKASEYAQRCLLVAGGGGDMASSKRAKTHTGSGVLSELMNLRDWLLECIQTMETKLKAMQEVPRDEVKFESMRKLAHDAAVKLDYARWMQKLNFKSPITLLDSLEKETPSNVYTHWVSDHEDKALKQALLAVESSRKNSAKVCDDATGRITALRMKFEALIEQAVNAKREFDSDLLMMRGEWKSLDVSLDAQGKLAREFKQASRVSVKFTNSIAPLGRTALGALVSIDITGTTMAKIESSLRNIVLGAAEAWLFIE